jgi:hypothetical protein
MHRIRRAAFIGLLIGVAPFAHAQTLGADPLTVDITPANPAPYQAITITPHSTLTDLSASTVTVTVNGTVVSKGSGGAGVSATVGGPGTATNIVVSVEGAGGNYSKSITLRPESVALIEEPDSTTHPFYGGGALIAPQGRVRLIAMPDFVSASGAKLSGDALVYNWKLGDQILEGSSGIGKSVLLVSAPVQYRDADIALTVSSQDGSLVGSASITLTPLSPMLLIYRNEPLLGPLFDEIAANPYTMEGDEDSFRAVPYFFAEAPSITWDVNGSNNGTEPVVTVRTTGASAGTAVLSATANQTGTYQTAQDSRTIHYGASTSGGGIFGL